MSDQPAQAPVPEWSDLSLQQRFAVLAAYGNFEHVEHDGRKVVVADILGSCNVLLLEHEHSQGDPVLCVHPVDYIMARMNPADIALVCICAGVDDPEAVECLACGAKACKGGDPLHYHHDGCPHCDTEGDA